MGPGAPRSSPPTFCPKRGRATNSASALNVTLPRQPFRQEDRAFAGAELGVVREDDILDALERRLVAHTADGDGHPVAGIPVAPWLGTEGIGGDLQGPTGC